MNTIVKRSLTAILSLLLIIYVGYQAYRAVYNPLRTSRATSGTYEDIISADSVVLHNEAVLDYKGDGVIDYVKEDGECVAKGGEVAAVFSNEQAAENSRKLSSLQSQLELYKQISASQDSSSSIDVNVLNSGINSSFLNLCDASGDSDMDKIENTKTEMLELLNKKQLATGKSNDFNKQIASIQDKINKLSQSSAKKSSSIVSPDSGYFVSKIDGLENCYDFSKVATITPKDVQNLLTMQPKKGNNEAGKILKGYESYIVCNLSKDDEYKLKEGQVVKLRFMYSSVPEMTVNVVAINKSQDGVAAVLKSTSMTGSFSVIRRQKAEIVSSRYKGIKVNNSYIHMTNGVKGVYIRSGNLINFRKIQPIFSSQGYTVSKINDQDTSSLQVYDEIITNGDDLYDGKTIK